MTVTQTHEMEGTVEQCAGMIKKALDGYDYEATDNRITVREGEKQLVIDLIDKGERELGSLELPMTRVDYTFDGYSQDEADRMVEDRLAPHMMRIGSLG